MDSKFNFDVLFEQTSDGLTIISDEKIVEINYASLKFLRANKKEDVLGKSIFEFIHHDSVELAIKSLQILEKTGDNVSRVVLKIKCLDGIVRRFEFSAITVIYNDKKSFLLISREIEDYLQTIDDFKEKEEKLKAVITALPDLMFIVNDKRIIVDYYTPDTDLLYLHPSKFLGESIHTSLPEYLAKMTDKAINRVLVTGLKEEIEYYLILNQQKKYFQAVFVKKSQDEVLITVRDITSKKETEIALENQLRFNEILTNLSMQFINCKEDDIDLVLNNALKKVGEFLNLDRVYIFKFDFDNKTMSNTHEWCATDVTPEIDNLQNVSNDLFPEFLAHILNRKTFIAENVSEIKEESLRNILQIQGILSIIICPIFMVNQCYGYVGFDIVKSYRKFNEKEISFLNLFAILLGSVFQKIKTEKELNNKTQQIYSSRLSILNIVDDLQREIRNKEAIEKELRLSEQKFRSYIENTKGIIFVIQRNGKFSYVSPAINEIFGYSSEELVGIHFSKYLHPSDTQKVFDQLKIIISTRKPFQSLPIRMKDKNGRYIWIIVNGAPIFNDDKQIQEIIGIALDVNELIEARQQLSLTEERYRSLFENQIEAYALNEIILDENGDPYDYRFIDVNKAFLEMTGLSSKNEIVGKTLLETWPNIEKDWITLFGQVALNGGKMTIEKSSPTFGKTFLINVYSTEKLKFATSFYDITDRKKSEIIRKIQLNIANAIIKSENLRELILTIRNELTTLIDTSNFFVATYDEDLKQFKTIVFLDEKDFLQPESIWDEEGTLSALVMKTKSPLILKKNEIDEFDRKNNIIHSEVNPEIWVGVPIISRRKSLGIIVVQSYTNPNAYDQSTVDLLQTIATQLAILFEQQEYEAQIKLLSKAIEKSSVMVIITDQNNNIQFANPKFYEITKYSKEEIIGKNPRILRSNYHSKEFYHNMWISISEGKSWQGEILNKDKYGNLYWVSAAITPIISHSGIITNYVSIQEDITEQKKLQEKIETSQKQLLSTWENSTDGMRLTDENGLIVDVNQALCNLYGVERERLIGKPFYYMIKNYSGGGLKTFKENIKSGKVEKVKEYEIELDNGKVFYIELTNSIVELDNNKRFLFSIFRDVTEKKKMIDELIKAKEKAEEMNKVKTQFFANMSHELRTPFMGILGYTELLKDKVIDEEGKFFIEGIIRSSNRMIDTLTNILDLTKLESGKTDTKKSLVDVKPIILEVYENFKYQAIKKNLTFNKNININDDFKLLLNEKLFRSILNNLISNAIKFTMQGSISINSYVNDSKFFLEVFDTGIGIPKEKQEIIFDEFRQVSEGHARAFEGTGLGLSIVKKFTELLGGKVELESELNKGSKFIVIFPI